MTPEACAKTKTNKNAVKLISARSDRNTQRTSEDKMTSTAAIHVCPKVMIMEGSRNSNPLIISGFLQKKTAAQ